MSEKKKEGFFKRLLDKVEVAGNKLPQPVTLFAMLMGIVLLLSWIFGSLGVSATHPASGEEVKAVNLLSADGVRRIMT
ncbi:AbgT family transporter, partial [Marinilabilia sp.]